MNNLKHRQDNVAKWLFWIARIWGSLVMALLLVYTVGGLPYLIRELSPREWLNPLTLFFSALGLGVAWRRERLGGGISLAFILINVVGGRWILGISDPPYMQLIVFAVPGILLVAYDWYTRKNRHPRG